MKPHEPPTILIVDDEPSNIFFFEGILEKEGYRVISAPNGQEALTIIRKTPPDLILSDLLMPKTHGFDLLKTLKNESHLAHIPVIIVTAVYKGPINRIEALKLGANELMEKPVDPDLLIQKVRHFLELPHD